MATEDGEPNESNLRFGGMSVSTTLPADGAYGVDLRRLLCLALVAFRLPLADNRHLVIR